MNKTDDDDDGGGGAEIGLRLVFHPFQHRNDQCVVIFQSIVRERTRWSGVGGAIDRPAGEDDGCYGNGQLASARVMRPSDSAVLLAELLFRKYA